MEHDDLIDAVIGVHLFQLTLVSSTSPTRLCDSFVVKKKINKEKNCGSIQKLGITMQKTRVNH
jgi:hypothetical protein